MKSSVTEATFPSSNKINTIHYYIYRNDTLPPKGILQISHGMCEYFLRYHDFARFLAGQGYIVCGNDHIGHGNSISKYDDLGYFGEQEGYRCLVEDVHTLTLLMRERYPGLPLVLMGHSMGSFIVRAYLDSYSTDIDGVIISGTSGGNPFAGVGISAAKFLIESKGSRHRSDFLKRLASFSTEKRYETHYHPEFDWLTRDTKVIDAYMKDKRCNFVFTVNGYLNLFTLLKNVSAPGWGKHIRKDLPVYIFSGSDDPVGDYGKGVKKVYHHLIKVGMQNVSLRLYEKGRHEMLNEINREEVYQYVLKWLNQTVKYPENASE